MVSTEVLNLFPDFALTFHSQGTPFVYILREFVRQNESSWR